MTRTEWMELARDVSLGIVKAWCWGIGNAPTFWIPAFVWLTVSGGWASALTVLAAGPTLAGLAYERGRLDEIKRRRNR